MPLDKPTPDLDLAHPPVPKKKHQRPTMMDSYGVRRSDTTKGPPLRILSLGMTLLLLVVLMATPAIMASC